MQCVHRSTEHKSPCGFLLASSLGLIKEGHSSQKTMSLSASPHPKVFFCPGLLALTAVERQLWRRNCPLWTSSPALPRGHFHAQALVTHLSDVAGTPVLG